MAWLGLAWLGFGRKSPRTLVLFFTGSALLPFRAVAPFPRLSFRAVAPFPRLSFYVVAPFL